MSPWRLGSCGSVCWHRMGFFVISCFWVDPQILIFHLRWNRYCKDDEESPHCSANSWRESFTVYIYHRPCLGQMDSLTYKLLSRCCNCVNTRLCSSFALKCKTHVMTTALFSSDGTSRGTEGPWEDFSRIAVPVSNEQVRGGNIFLLDCQKEAKHQPSQQLWSKKERKSSPEGADVKVMTSSSALFISKLQGTIEKESAGVRKKWESREKWNVSITEDGGDAVFITSFYSCCSVLIKDDCQVWDQRRRLYMFLFGFCFVCFFLYARVLTISVHMIQISSFPNNRKNLFHICDPVQD